MVWLDELKAANPSDAYNPGRELPRSVRNNRRSLACVSRVISCSTGHYRSFGNAVRGAYTLRKRSSRAKTLRANEFQLTAASPTRIAPVLSPGIQPAFEYARSAFPPLLSPRLTLSSHTCPRT